MSNTECLTDSNLNKKCLCNNEYIWNSTHCGKTLIFQKNIGLDEDKISLSLILIRNIFY